MRPPASDQEERLRRLLEVGRALVSEFDLEAVLEHVLEAARELTGARYAAVGVLDQSRERLERFITVGVDEETQQAIGDLPRGHGVLGGLDQRAEAASAGRGRCTSPLIRLPARTPADAELPRRADPAPR